MKKICCKGHDLTKPGALMLVMGTQWACRECTKERAKKKAKLRVTMTDRVAPMIYPPAANSAQTKSK